MDISALQGSFADHPIDAAFAFRSAMTALARPGTITTLAGATPPAPLSPAAGALLLTLCDPDTPVYLAGAADTADARDWITFHTGAPLTQATKAMFAVGTWDDLHPLDAYAIGTPEYPDRSATLIIECPALAAHGATLTGPGIRNTATLRLPELAAFQANHARFPLGWDAFLTADDQIAGLPRSTEVR